MGIYDGRDYFFITLGKNNWEFLFLGFLLDLLLSFSLFFFTIQIFAALVASLLGVEFFKTENLYNYLTKAFLLSMLVAVISTLFFIFDFSGDLPLSLSYAILAFAKIFLPLSLLIILAKMGELSRGKEIFFK